MKKMINILGAVSLLLAPSMAMCQTAFTLNGKIGQLSTPAKAYLMYQPTGGKQIHDSTTIINGAFSFKGTIDQPELAYLIINQKGSGLHSKGGRSMSLYLESGSMSVTSPDSLSNAKISGSTYNADKAKLDKVLAPIYAKKLEISKEVRSASAAQKTSREFIRLIDARRDSLEMAQKAVYVAFIKTNPNSMVSIVALSKYSAPIPNVAELEPLFNLLSTQVKSSKMGKDYAAYILEMKKTSVGGIAPDFAQADTSGKMVSLKDFRGKYVLLEFWASWCAPCRAESPNVVKAFNDFKEKNFTVFSVSLDNENGKKAWLAAIQKDKVGAWTHVSDLKSWDNAAAKQYNIKAIPQNFLIDPQGKIIASNLRGKELQEKLATMLK